MLLGVDVGGTFTDAVLAFDGGVVTAKAPTTPGDQSEGVIAAIEAALERAGREAAHIEGFAHGMTVATNALLEGRGARTALVATEGFTDLIALGRQNRAELYRLCAARPEPLVPPERRFGAPERMGPDGPQRELDDAAADELAERVAESEPESVAVVLLHAYRHPEHEHAVARALRKALPDVHVSLSHEVVGTFREYERAATTEIDAALSPLLAGYLERLRDRCDQEGIPEPAIMQSNGGLIDLDAAAGHAAWTVLSGPAGGAAGAAFVARAAGVPDALCFDMGGTSCDVCVVDDGAVQEQSAGVLADRPLALPMLAIHTVGAGGGSVAWADPGGALRVGPRSAGADPGPACYGRGGTEPTVTDANLLLGYLDPDQPLAGGVSLDLEAAGTAIGELADRLGLEPVACAEGILRVANAEMVRALRVVTVERGIDPRRYALMAFGGAGGLHAAAIADELGIGEIVCPRASGVLAALGLVVSPRRRDVQRTVLLSGEALTAEAIAEVGAELGEQARKELDESPDDSRAAQSGEAGTAGGARGRRAGGGREPELTATYELRYRGQAFELPIEGEPEPEIDQLREDFEAEHERRYGYRDSEQELELVTIRITAMVPGIDVELAGGRDDDDLRHGGRKATLHGEEMDFEVLAGLPSPGTEITGPALVQLPEATLLVAPGWAGEVDATGTIRIQRDHSDD